MNLWAGDGLLLVEQSGAHFDFAAYSKCVDFYCWAIWTLGFKRKCLPFVALRRCAICNNDMGIG